MTDLRTAAQQALEAMRCGVPTGKITLYAWDKAMAELKAALAEEALQRFTDVNQEIEAALAEPECPLGQASTDVPLTVYSVKKAEPVERKPMNEFDALRLVTETVGLLQSAGPVEGLIGIIRAVERAHGIT